MTDTKGRAFLKGGSGQWYECVVRKDQKMSMELATRGG